MAHEVPTTDVDIEAWLVEAGYTEDQVRDVRGPERAELLRLVQNGSVAPEGASPFAEYDYQAMAGAIIRALASRAV